MELKPEYKQTDVGNIPVDWEVFQFGDLVNYTKGYPFKSSGYCNHGVRIIRVSDTTYDSIEDVKAVYISEEHSRAYKKWQLSENDLIFSTVGSKPPMYESLVGKAILIPKAYFGSLLNQNAVIIRSKDFSSYMQRLLLNHFRTKRYIEYIEQIFRGNANQASITLKNLFQYQIPLPPTKEEQRAIATALSDVDALLNGLDRLIAKKRDLKQAAMKQLLTGETRLPGFEGGWVVKTVGDISEVGRGRVISHVEIARAPSPTYPVYSSQTSNNGVMGYLDTYDFEGDYITWTTDGANAGTVFARSGRFNCTNVCGTIKVHNSDHRFIAAILGQVTQPHVSRHLGNPKLMNDVMKKIEIKIPETLGEQAAIAEVLSDIDVEIATLEQRRNKTKDIKQAMMQELLTGKIRLVTPGDSNG